MPTDVRPIATTCRPRQFFIQRLLFYHFDPKVVSEIIESDVYGRARARRTKAQHELQQWQWLVLPSHPLWHSMKINKIVKWAMDHDDTKCYCTYACKVASMNQEQPVINCSWKSDEVHFEVKLRRINKLEV